MLTYCHDSLPWRGWPLQVRKSSYPWRFLLEEWSAAWAGFTQRLLNSGHTHFKPYTAGQSWKTPTSLRWSELQEHVTAGVEVNLLVSCVFFFSTFKLLTFTLLHFLRSKGCAWITSCPGSSVQPLLLSHTLILNNFSHICNRSTRPLRLVCGDRRLCPDVIKRPVQ